MRVRVTGEVEIKDKKGNIYKYKNQIQPTLIPIIMQYARLGGTISNYSYLIKLLSNDTLAGHYTGTLTYKQTPTSLQLIFTFIINDAPLSTNVLQLFLSSSLGDFFIAQADNVELPSGSIQIVWTISFNISPQDYFTPYLIFAFFSPPSNQTPFINTPLPNIQYAIDAIQNMGYLVPSPAYYVTYNGQYIQVPVTFTDNSISIRYQFQPATSSVTYINLNIAVTAYKGYVNLMAPIQSITINPGQLAILFYDVTWATS